MTTPLDPSSMAVRFPNRVLQCTFLKVAAGHEATVAHEIHRLGARRPASWLGCFKVLGHYDIAVILLREGFEPDLRLFESSSILQHVTFRLGPWELDQQTIDLHEVLRHPVVVLSFGKIDDSRTGRLSGIVPDVAAARRVNSLIRENTDVTGAVLWSFSHSELCILMGGSNINSLLNTVLQYRGDTGEEMAPLLDTASLVLVAYEWITGPDGSFRFDRITSLEGTISPQCFVRTPTTAGRYAYSAFVEAFREYDFQVEPPSQDIHFRFIYDREDLVIFTTDPVPFGRFLAALLAARIRGPRNMVTATFVTRELPWTAGQSFQEATRAQTGDSDTREYDELLTKLRELRRSEFADELRRIRNDPSRRASQTPDLFERTIEVFDNLRDGLNDPMTRRALTDLAYVGEIYDKYAQLHSVYQPRDGADFATDSAYAREQITTELGHNALLGDIGVAIAVAAHAVDQRTDSLESLLLSDHRPFWTSRPDVLRILEAIQDIMVYAFEIARPALPSTKWGRGFVTFGDAMQVRHRIGGMITLPYRYAFAPHRWYMVTHEVAHEICDTLQPLTTADRQMLDARVGAIKYAPWHPEWGPWINEMFALWFDRNFFHTDIDIFLRNTWRGWMDSRMRPGDDELSWIIELFALWLESHRPGVFAVGPDEPPTEEELDSFIAGITSIQTSDASRRAADALGAEQRETIRFTVAFVMPILSIWRARLIEADKTSERRRQRTDGRMTAAANELREGKPVLGSELLPDPLELVFELTRGVDDTTPLQTGTVLALVATLSHDYRLRTQRPTDGS